jgi:hypothetical protein
MKKIIFLFSAVLLITGCTPPKEEIDVAKEEEAVKAAIKKELALWLAQDYIPESDLVKKEDYVRMITNFGNNHNQTVGWDSINANLKRSSEQDWSDATNAKIECKDFNIKVYDKVAWAVYYTQMTGEWKGEPFDNNTTRVTFLEKVDDTWKIVLNSMTGLNPCETEDEDEERDEDDN